MQCEILNHISFILILRNNRILFIYNSIMTSSYNANETIKINYLFSESLNFKNMLLTDLVIFHSILFYNFHTLSLSYLD